MSGVAAIAVQDAIRTTLLASGAVTSLLASNASVYDEAPQNAELPYISLDDTTEVAWNQLGSGAYGANVTAMLHIFDHSLRGFAKAEAIAGACVNALRSPSGSTLTISGYTCHACMYESTDRIVEDAGDGTTIKHVAVLMRVYCTEA